MIVKARKSFMSPTRLLAVLLAGSAMCAAQADKTATPAAAPRLPEPPEPDAALRAMTRASYAGGHRYAVTWTGDNSSNWSHLRQTVHGKHVFGRSFI